MLHFLILFILFFQQDTYARVFNIHSESFAAFFRGSYAPSTISKAAFEKASSYNEVYNAEVNLLQSGEFGFVHATHYLNVKYSIEVIRASSLTKMDASTTGGTSLYLLDSNVSAVIPKFGLEFNLKQWPASRISMNLTAGQANLVLSNAYSFSNEGTTATGKTDYTEEGRATATLLDGGLALETLVFDTTTILFDIGYRQLIFSSITHNRDCDCLIGAKVKGDQIINTDGANRIINMTGSYAGIGFRFWIR